MISKFVNREEELSTLEDEWKKEGGRLIVLYGRRRIGKTRLLTEFTTGRRGIFYIAEDSSTRIQIEGLKERIADFLNDNLLRTLEIKDWGQLFEYLARNSPKKRFYLVIDEFSYLIRSEKRILSVLQKHWDTRFAASSIFIVLSGSILGLMEDMVLSQASPLYGRRSRDVLLEGLPIEHARKFLSMPFQEALEVYMSVGGVPEYLMKAAEHRRYRDFIEGEFFSKRGYFYREPYFIISQEFRELKTYFSILNAIAYGCTKPTEIANFVGVEARGIYPYLENLIRLGFVERRVPILGEQKKGIYLIMDHVFDFWFNFVFRHREEVERGGFALRDAELSSYFGKKFEDLAAGLLRPLLPHNRFGSWWQRGEEIDLVALNDSTKEIAFFECKWSSVSEEEAAEILAELKRKAALVKRHNGERMERYGIVAKALQGKEGLREKGCLAYDLRDFEEACL